MAKIISMSLGKNSIDCILSGTIGNKVWVNNKGINYTRSKPTVVSKPKTAAQLDHIAKFTVLMKFIKPFTQFIRVGFKNYTVNMSAFNAAISYNYHHALIGSYPEYELDYTKVLISQGSLPGALNPEVRITPAGEIEFTWEDNSHVIHTMADDKVLLAVLNSSKQEAVILIGGNTRIGGSQVIVLPSTFEGDEVQCYMAFQNVRKSVVSNSQYIGRIQITRI